VPAGARPEQGGHALFVGGSGMLAGLCRSLAAHGWHLTVVGRDRAKLAGATAADVRLHPLSVDYQDVAAFSAALAAAAAARGPFMLAVCWIRSWASQSLLAAADAVASGGRLFHVLGSQASEASAGVIAELGARRELHYRRVQLGAVGEATPQRWLTNAEISDGVYAAIAADRPYCSVGTVAP
jgi:NAD(P)-dependent dehydrogenase (short-subunit alcohol dehydrogenase family)